MGPKKASVKPNLTSNNPGQWLKWLGLQAYKFLFKVLAVQSQQLSGMEMEMPYGKVENMG